MRIFLLGDVHGDVDWLRRSVKRASELGIDQILQLGDFGFWEHDPKDTFMDDALEACERYEVALDWIDGNHECHPLLRSRYGPTGDRRDDNTTADGWFIRWPWLRHRPRGSRWTWGDRTFVALGGAYSIDKPYRKPGTSWWHQEMINNDEADLAIEGGGVDVLVSHDVPAVGDQAMRLINGWKEHHLTEANRHRLQRVMDRTQPSVVVHGHYHVRYAEWIAGANAWIYGRASNFERDESWGVLDTETLRVTNVDEKL